MGYTAIYMLQLKSTIFFKNKVYLFIPYHYIFFYQRPSIKLETDETFSNFDIEVLKIISNQFLGRYELDTGPKNTQRPMHPHTRIIPIPTFLE